jgi:hypothetical protein
MFRPACVAVAAAAVLFATEQNHTDATAEDEPAGPAVADCNGHRFTVPRGFGVALVAKYPVVYRPVSAAFDAEGRLFVTDSAGADPVAERHAPRRHRLVHLDRAQPDGRVLSGRVIASDLPRPLGLTVRGGTCAVAGPDGVRTFPAEAGPPRIAGATGLAFRANFHAGTVTRHGPGGTADFLTSDNPDFHPTDVTPDADGSLIVVDTGGWGDPFAATPVPARADGLGAIYRVKLVGHNLPR